MFNKIYNQHYTLHEIWFYRISIIHELIRQFHAGMKNYRHIYNNNPEQTPFHSLDSFILDLPHYYQMIKWFSVKSTKLNVIVRCMRYQFEFLRIFSAFDWNYRQSCWKFCIRWNSSSQLSALNSMRYCKGFSGRALPITWLIFYFGDKRVKAFTVQIPPIVRWTEVHAIHRN